MIGATLSHYRITDELGRGGMGIVYKAEDTKLDRLVAIKVLPSATLATEDDRSRFYREAKAAAALHHPNIASVFEIDEAVPSNAPHDAQPSPFLAMEFIEGETLDARIAKQPLKIDEVIKLASEVAEGLKAAHGKEIVHRDIKSANVMIDADGRAKILDFGLAQTAHSTKLTRMGSTLGTMAYMSPEQAKGEEVDLRTDLWALGVVIYEMVTGALPFASDYEQAAVYSILNEEPEPITALRSGVPMALENVVGKCLAKDRKLRYASAADLLVDLVRVNVGMSTAPHSAIRPAAAPAASAPVAKFSTPSLIVGSFGVLALAISLVLFFMRSVDEPSSNFKKLTLHLDGIAENWSPALSPDGQYIAFSGVDSLGKDGVFLNDLLTGSISYITESEGSFYPLFSSSGNRMTIGRGAGRPLFVVDVPSGTPRQILDDGYTGYWINDDELIYTINDLHKYTLSTGDTEMIYRADSVNGIARWPFPGPKVPGQPYIVGNLQYGGLDSEPQLFTLNLDTNDIILGERGVINPQPISSDILLYQISDDNGDLFARRFDASTASFTSPSHLVRSPMKFAAFHVGPDGSLLISTEASKRPLYVVDIVIADQRSEELSTIDLQYADRFNALSAVVTADSRFLLTDARESSSETIIPFVTDLETKQTTQRHTQDGVLALSVSSDGVSYYAARIMGRSTQDSKDVADEPALLLRMPINGRGQIDTLLTQFDNVWDAAESSAGIVVNVQNESERSAFIGILKEDGSVDPITARAQDSYSFDTAVSQDGNFLAYFSIIGSSEQITVRDLSSGDEITILEPGRGLKWSPDGQYLYFQGRSTIRRIKIESQEGLSTTGESEIVLYGGDIFDPSITFDIDPQSGDIIALSDNASFNKKLDSYSTIEWWQGYADVLDEILEKE